MKVNKVICRTIFILLVVFLLSGCTDKDIYKFVLDTPTIEANGITISWEKVENADKYKIYNAKNDVLIGETTDLSYTCEDITDFTEVYIRAFYEKKDFRFRGSGKSNVVSLAAPILGRPILSTNKNSITWQKVVGASYYKIFNSANDELIGETSDLSYKFENNDNQNLRVYIIAYYKSVELMDKKSSKSNVVKVNPDILIVDVKEIDSSVSEYVLEDYVKKVTFIGSSSCSFGINITDRNTKLDITFDNLQMQTNDGSCLLAKNNNSEINLTIIGSCKLRSMNSNAIKVPKLNLLGNSDSSLHVVGGNGANGTNGLNGNAGSEDGYSGTNGTNGKNGNDGYSAILASQLTVSNIKLTTIGGNGGKGGDGGNGGNGGNGGKGAYGINTSCNIKEIGSASVNIFSGNYGAGGNGGNGGKGGKGGNYYNSLGSVWRCSGGNGGNGGNGGDGIIGGNAGTGGKYGNPGDGEPVNGIGVGINYGAVFSDNIQPSRGSNGTKGKSLK